MILCRRRLGGLSKIERKCAKKCRTFNYPILETLQFAHARPSVVEMSSLLCVTQIGLVVELCDVQRFRILMPPLLVTQMFAQLTPRQSLFNSLILNSLP